MIEEWYVTRFMRLRRRRSAIRPPISISTPRCRRTKCAKPRLTLWREINLKNLEENILPTRRRAQLILQKGESHRVEKVSLRKI